MLDKATTATLRKVCVCDFDVYGFRFSLRGAVAEPIEGLREDFAFFSCAPGSAEIKVELYDEDPPWDSVPTCDASIYTPRNVVYRYKGTRYIDYHGRGLGIQDGRTGVFRLYSRDLDLLYEATYLFLLSRIGQALDHAGIHRVHGLGAEVNGRAVIVLLPMGGGKSTLGLHLLSIPQVRLLSDDSPWIDRKGRVLAYPLRLGLLPGSEQVIPKEHRRVVHRMEFGPKYLVNFSYFRERVCRSAEPGVVFIGARTLSEECRIEEVGVLAGLRAVVANCVIGVGLFQGLEFILQSSAWELVSKAGLGMSRMWNCWQLLRRSRVCRVHLGRDPEQNAQTVFEYARALPRRARSRPAL